MSDVRRMNDPLINIGLILLGTGLLLAAMLSACGNLTAWLTNQAPPTGPLTRGIGVLAQPGSPGDALGSPGLNPVLYWFLVIICLTLLGWVTWVVTRALRERDTRPSPHTLTGIATPAEIREVASEKALLKKAATLRPSLTAPTPREVGMKLGTSKGIGVWATVEDSILITGPPRSGKGLFLVINSILDAPGAVITTSTRPDNVTATLTQRKRVGPVMVFDPQQIAPGLSAGLRWSPIRGCADPLTAMIRATGLAASTGFGGVQSGDFWEGKTRIAIQCLLHAAALDNRETKTVYAWALTPASAFDAVRILQADPRAAEGWAEALDGMLQSDPRTRDSIWQGVSLAFAALADPRVLEAVSPGPDEHFDPENFLTQRGTIYMLATGAGAGASAGLVAAFIEDLVETARRMAARSPGARLDPPLHLALDEIANLAPLPSLPTLMAEGGGTGITAMPVFQSLSRAREKWGDDEASAIWDAAIVKIILGGASNTRELQDLSTLIGEHDERTDSVTVDATGAHSSQRSLRRVPILPPDALRTLPFGTGIIMLRSARPIMTSLHPWTKRPDAPVLTADRKALEATIQQAST